MTPIETDEIKRKAVIDFLSAVGDVMEIGSVKSGRTYLQFHFDGLVYRIGDISGMSPSEIGRSIKDIILTGESEYITDVRREWSRKEWSRRRNHGRENDGKTD